LPHQFSKFGIFSLPTRLILPIILTTGCITDADLVPSRTQLIEETRENLTRFQSIPVRKGVMLPLASRQWARLFLMVPRRTGMPRAAIDTNRRESRKNGNTSNSPPGMLKTRGRITSLFTTFSGICRPGFNLVLEGNPVARRYLIQACTIRRSSEYSRRNLDTDSSQGGGVPVG